LFVPVYRQITPYGLTKVGLSGNPVAIANEDVSSAWHDYLAHDNDGRGVILIGHSQGAGQALRLLRDEIEKSPAELGRLVAAYVIGGNVLVPQGKDVGGDLQKIPVCRSRTQHGCIVGFSSFDQHPPSNTLFGRPADAFATVIPADQRAGLQVLCVNPAALSGGTAKLDTYISIPSRLSSSPPGPGFDAWPDQISGTCTSVGDTTWLQIDHPTTGRVIPPIHDSLGPSWGLHRLDMSVAQGDLISLAAAQTAAWHS
jgi:pimeloyl-ACP methyl ester carboxylesterase